MRRRKFLFRSMQASLLLSPVLELRRTYAQTSKKVIPFFFIDGGSPYPYPTDFFPKASNSAKFQLSPILSNFSSLRSDMVVLDGVNINPMGPNIKNNWHVSSVGKVLTAKAVHDLGNLDGEPGGPSIDQVIANNLGVRSIEVFVNNNERYSHMRSRPFATGNRRFKLPISSAVLAWDNLFKDCQPNNSVSNTAQGRINRLKADKSILDSLTSDLKRFRRELVGVEKIKLDSHEDAIRQSERSVAASIKDLENENNNTGFDCKVPGNLGTSNIPLKSKAFFDVMYAALKTERVGVAGMMHGYSSTTWDYSWINFDNKPNDNVHDGIYHHAADQRENFIKIANWKWTQIADFAKRLKAEPGGSLLDKVLIYATSHFGRHHRPENIPVILIGNAQGQLKTGRVLKVDTFNDKPLTSVAHFCGANIRGIGDDPNCGPLSVLHS